MVNELKRHLSVHSVPKTVFSDNGTQFSSQTLHDFATTWDFCHVTSSPEYPQANDLAERAVRSTQRLLETSKRDGTDLLLVLLNIRNVPRDTTLGSPAQHLLSRRTRTTPPASLQLLIPSYHCNGPGSAVKETANAKRTRRQIEQTTTSPETVPNDPPPDNKRT